MLSFESDYTEGAHPNILRQLMATNMVQEPGYGFDEFSQLAKERIQKALEHPEAQIEFLTGGTQTNQVVIDAMLTQYQGVIAAETGHINVHEAGAIEATGHKVLALPAKDAKLDAQTVDQYIQTFDQDENRDHMVFPGMVYITYPTEFGTLYSREELAALHAVCQKHSIPLYIDGARLGYGLMSAQADLQFSDLPDLCDVFYIGGTKQGALCGEAVVFCHHNEPDHFLTIVKQHGALLAKGRLLGVQFAELFKDDLYFKLSKHADELAAKIKRGFLDKGYRLYLDSVSNQQFFIVDNQKIAELAKKVRFARWEKYDDQHSVIRFVACWATPAESVDQLLKLI